jgi:predicted nucleotidyltransferase
MDRAIRAVLAADPRVGYALVFGSQASGRAHASSDIDVAIGLKTGSTLDHHEIGELISRLEQAIGRTTDLTILTEAPAPLAYRAFRDGRVVFEADPATLVRDQVRAILTYLDFKPVEDLCARAVIAAAADGR